MICMKPQCCKYCNIKNDCPCECGHNNIEYQKEIGIDTLEEFEIIYCEKCSFRNFKDMEE